MMKIFNMFFVMNYINVFQEEGVEPKSARGADMRVGKGTRGVRDKVKFPVGRSWADMMEDEKDQQVEEFVDYFM